jgi:hypothetical protein
MDRAVIADDGGNTMADFARVLTELQQERSRLDQAIQAIGKLVGRNNTKTTETKGNRPRRKLSAAGRRRIAAAQRARWAKLRSQNSAKGQIRAMNTGKRTMSAAARSKIAAAQRARWAKLKKAA